MNFAPRVPVARLVGLFGVAGELKARLTPAGAGLLEAGRRYWLVPEGESESIVLAKVRVHHERPLVMLEGITSPEAARAFIGRDLFVERIEIRLGPGEYLDDDLIGCQLVDEAGTPLARVTGVEHYPAQDCLRVDLRGALVPMVREFVRAIDLNNRRIVTSLPPGLLDSAAEIDDGDRPPRPSRARRSPK